MASGDTYYGCRTSEPGVDDEHTCGLTVWGTPLVLGYRTEREGGSTPDIREEPLMPRREP